MTTTAAAAKNTPPMQRLKPHLDALRALLASLRRGISDAARAFWQNERRWLWVIVPVVVLAFVSTQWASSTWNSLDYALLFQPLTPLVAAALAWTLRFGIKQLVQEMDFLYPGDSPKRRGKLWPVLLGCLLMIVAGLVTSATLAFVALFFIVVGSIYYVYGPYITRAVWQPLVLLALVIPIPANFLHTLSATLSLGGSAVGGQVLQTMVPGAQGQYGLLMMPNYQMEVGSALNGINVVLPSVVLILWYCLFRRIHAGFSLLFLAAAAGIASVLNLGRILLIALIGNRNSTLADSMREPAAARIGSVLLIAATFVLTLYVIRLVGSRRMRRVSAFEADLREAHRMAQEQAAPSAADTSGTEAR